MGARPLARYGWPINAPSAPAGHLRPSAGSGPSPPGGPAPYRAGSAHRSFPLNAHCVRRAAHGPAGLRPPASDHRPAAGSCAGLPSGDEMPMVGLRCAPGTNHQPISHEEPVMIRIWPPRTPSRSLPLPPALPAVATGPSSGCLVASAPRRCASALRAPGGRYDGPGAGAGPRAPSRRREVEHRRCRVAGGYRSPLRGRSLSRAPGRVAPAGTRQLGCAEQLRSLSSQPAYGRPGTAGPFGVVRYRCACRLGPPHPLRGLRACLASAPGG